MSKQHNLNYRSDFDLLMQSGDIKLLRQYLEAKELSGIPNLLSYTFMDLCHSFKDNKEYRSCFAYILNQLEDRGRDLDFTNDRGQTALMLLSLTHSTGQMKVLLNKNVDINKTDNNNENVLFYSLNSQGDFEAKLKMLMSFNIDLNDQNISGVS